MTKKRKSDGPRKPRPDFPLFPHATGRWAKKVRQKLRYFGKVADDPKGEKALALWLDQKDDLLAGRTPRKTQGGLIMRDLLNAYLTAKRHRLDSGELSPRSFGDLYQTCQRLAKQLGLTRLVEDLVADDFQELRATMAKAWGPVRLADEIQKVRGVFRYAYDANLIDKPVRFGPGFTKPSQQAMRLNRAKQGPKMFEAEQIRALLKASPVQLKAMILLGVNCGFGNGDLTHLPLSALDLKAGWVTYPRPKTGIPRRCPLWPETVAAVAQAIGSRPKPFDKEDAGLAFLTPLGRRWTTAVVTDTTVWHNDALTREFRRLLEQLKLYRPGLGFYALRHTFETVAGDSKDQVAVNAIMGHAPAVGDMSAVYRERISDDRLRAVVDHVHGWLWPVAGTKEGK